MHVRMPYVLIKELTYLLTYIVVVGLKVILYRNFAPHSTASGVNEPAWTRWIDELGDNGVIARKFRRHTRRPNFITCKVFDWSSMIARFCRAVVLQGTPIRKIPDREKLINTLFKYWVSYRQLTFINETSDSLVNWKLGEVWFVICEYSMRNCMFTVKIEL